MNKSNYIGSGAYGCVVKPSFDCDLSKNKLIDNTVAKLFSYKSEYENEVKTHLRIQKIDKNNSFTVKLLSHCTINSSFMNENVNNINRCEIIKGFKEIYQIIYQDGGQDLRDFFKIRNTNFDSYNFLKKFIVLFKGIELLIKNKITHSDIRTDNLLFNGNNIYLIDFGLALNFKGFLDDDLIKDIAYTDKEYYYYPDEIKLYLNQPGEFFKPSMNSDDFLYKIDLHTNLIYYSNSFDSDYDRYLNEIIKLNEYLKSRFLTFYSTFNKKDYGTKENASLIIASKFDIYQLGTALYKIVLSIIRLYDKNEMMKIPIGIFSVIKQMLEPDARKRINITSLINQYSKLF